MTEDLFGNPIEENTKKSKKELTAEIATLFEQWWKFYPRKIAIGKARESFYKKYKAGAFQAKDIPAMVETLKWQTTELWIGRNEHYIPHGSTYLNQERWKDERPTRTGEAFQRSTDVDDPF